MITDHCYMIKRVDAKGREQLIIQSARHSTGKVAKDFIATYWGAGTTWKYLKTMGYSIVHVELREMEPRHWTRKSKTEVTDNKPSA